MLALRLYMFLLAVLRLALTVVFELRFREQGNLSASLLFYTCLIFFLQSGAYAGTQKAGLVSTSLGATPALFRCFCRLALRLALKKQGW